MRQVIEVPWRLEKQDARYLPNIYAKVFAGEPWKEVSRCPKCGAFSGSDPGERMLCTTEACKGRFSEEAYPRESTQAYIEAELSKSMAKGEMQVKVEAIRITIEQILAFGWGYASMGLETARDKYTTDEMREVVSDLLVNAGVFFYISEIGVDPQEQGRGLGKSLTKSLATEGKRKLGTVVLRTNENSPMRYIAQNLGMKEIIGLNTGIKDTENESRVLFVGGAYDRE